MQHVEGNSINLNIHILRASNGTATICIILVCILQCYAFSTVWTPNESIIARRYILTILSCNFLFAIIGMSTLFTCWMAPIINVVLFDIYIGCRLINILFIVYRAGCSQGLSPVLDSYCFSKTLPLVLVIWYGTQCLFTSTLIFAPEYTVCVDDSFSYQTTEPIFTVIFFAVDCGFTVFVTLLFAIPLYRGHKSYKAQSQLVSLELSPRDIKSRRILKTALQYGVAMSLINQMTSNVTMVTVVFREDFPFVFYFVLWDPVVNVISSVLLLRKNRVFLEQIACCCKGRRHGQVREHDRRLQKGRSVRVRFNTFWANVTPQSTFVSKVSSHEDVSLQVSNKMDFSTGSTQSIALRPPQSFDLEMTTS